MALNASILHYINKHLINLKYSGYTLTKNSSCKLVKYPRNLLLCFLVVSASPEFVLSVNKLVCQVLPKPPLYL